MYTFSDSDIANTMTAEMSCTPRHACNISRGSKVILLGRKVTDNSMKMHGFLKCTWVDFLCLSFGVTSTSK